MKRVGKYFSIILMLMIATNLFSAVSSTGTTTLDKVISTYQDFIKDYISASSKIPIVKKLKEELKFLAVYRLIKLDIAGSVEKKESTSNISEYLTAFYNGYKPPKIEEKLALAGLLAYVMAKLSNENLEISIINRLPAFISAFNDYVASMIREFRNLSNNLIAYSLGLVKEIPEDFEDMKVLTHLNIEGNFSQFSVRNYDYYEDLLEIFKRTDLEASILKKANEIKNSNIKDFKDLNRKIMIASSGVSRDLREILSSFQLDLAKKMVLVTPKRFNFWWLRLVVYGLFLILGFKYLRKILNMIIYTIVGFESFYILLFSNGLFGKLDSIVYSFLILIYIFAIFRFIQLLVQKRLSLFSTVSGSISILIFIMIFFVPMYSKSDSLKVSSFNDFENSVYYKLLKQDLYLDKNSDINRNLSSLYSITSKEFSELKEQIRKSEKFVNALYGAGAFSKMLIKNNNKFDAKIPSFSDFYSFSNWENYNSLFSERTKDLKEFERKSKERKKQIIKLKNTILLIAEKYFPVFTGKMRQDFYDFLNSFLSKSRTVGFLVGDIKTLDERFSKKPPRPIKVKVYKTRMGNIVFVLGLFSFILMFLFKKNYYKITSAFLLITTVFWFTKMSSAEIFVDENIPSLHFNDLSNPNYLIPIFFLLLAVFSLINKKLLKG